MRLAKARHCTWRYTLPLHQCRARFLVVTLQSQAAVFASQSDKFFVPQLTIVGKCLLAITQKRFAPPTQRLRIKAHVALHVRGGTQPSVKGLTVSLLNSRAYLSVVPSCQLVVAIVVIRNVHAFGEDQAYCPSVPSNALGNRFGRRSISSASLPTISDGTRAY